MSCVRLVFVSRVRLVSFRGVAKICEAKIVSIWLQLFSELLNNLKLSSNFISGSHNIRERKELVKKLERKTKEVEILSNARVLSEGIDLPELDCISFIDPKSSVVDIVQAVGRAIRASKDKKKIGYAVSTKAEI